MTTDGDHAMMDAIVQVSFSVMAGLTRIGTAHGLSLTQLRVLAILRDHEPTMADLAGHLGLDRSTVSGLIDRSVRRGLVERVANVADRRSIKVTFTPRGRELADRLTTEIAAEVERLVTRLDDADRPALQALLERLLPR